MSSPKPDAGEIVKRLKSVLDYVHDCDRRVGRGEIMDLQGLDNSVIELCNDIAALPPKDARRLEDQMTKLIESLETLAGSMKSQQETLGTAGAAR